MTFDEAFFWPFVWKSPLWRECHPWVRCYNEFLGQPQPVGLVFQGLCSSLLIHSLDGQLAVGSLIVPVRLTGELPSTTPRYVSLWSALGFSPFFVPPAPDNSMRYLSPTRVQGPWLSVCGVAQVHWVG